MTYQIKNWPDNFEGAKSRTYNNKTSCTMPTKHGLGYRKLVRQEDGAALFGAWCALVQVLSRHQKERAGYCTEDGSPTGKPLTCDDLEMLTDIPAAVFARLFEVASGAVGWVESRPNETPTDTTRIPRGYHGSPQYPLNSDLDSDSDLDSNSNSDSQAGAREDGKSNPPPDREPTPNPVNDDEQPSQPDSVDVDELTVQYCMAYKEVFKRELPFQTRNYAAKLFIRRCLCDGVTRERIEDALTWLVPNHGTTGVPSIKVPAKLETDWFDRIIDARTRIEKQESEDIGRF